MANIAIFCDGTWNNENQTQPTHVHRLFKAVKLGASQRPIYVPGVGNSGGPMSRIGGGAFGWGLNDNIKRAYRALAMHYKKGDRIFIFGFSRGAYTARSLAGMIRKVGIIDKPTTDRVDQAFDIYRLRGAENHPDEAHLIEKRRRLSPRFATSTDEIEYRRENPLTDPLAVDDTQPDLVTIAYLGIWDTVGSLGIPTSILGPVAHVWNRKYRFHDTRLSKSVLSARHAVALDERRIFYRPSLWDNLEQNPRDKGLNKGDRSPDRPFQQQWFVGNHALVGGSGATRPLAAITLDWIAQGANKAGLQLKDSPPLLDCAPDPAADCAELGEVSLVYRLAGSMLDWRKGPGHRIDLHESVPMRLERRGDYRPLSLRALMPNLFKPGSGAGLQPQRPDTGGAER